MKLKTLANWQIVIGAVVTLVGLVSIFAPSFGGTSVYFSIDTTNGSFFLLGLITLITGLYNFKAKK